MPTAFYHIYLRTPGVSPTDPLVQDQLNLAIDWYRYLPTCWIVYTTSDAKKWYRRLENVVKLTDGNVLVCKLDVSDRQGWMGKNFWDWLRKKR